MSSSGDIKQESPEADQTQGPSGQVEMSDKDEPGFPAPAFRVQ